MNMLVITSTHHTIFLYFHHPGGGGGGCQEELKYCRRYALNILFILPIKEGGIKKMNSQDDSDPFLFSVIF